MQIEFLPSSDMEKVFDGLVAGPQDDDDLGIALSESSGSESSGDSPSAPKPLVSLNVFLVIVDCCLLAHSLGPRDVPIRGKASYVA